MSRSKGIQVCGMGVVHGLGDAEALLSAAQGGTITKGTVEDVSLIEELKRELANVSLRRVPSFVRLALLGILRTLKNAEIAPKELTENCGLIIGSSSCCVEQSYDFMDGLLKDGAKYASPTAFSHSVNNVAVGLCSKILGLHGPGCMVSQFSFSFACALEIAQVLLMAKRIEYALVGVVETLDARYLATFPELEQGKFPPTQGAVFLLLTEALTGPFLDLEWNATRLLTRNDFCSGKEIQLQAKRCERVYGNTPMAQAFNTVLALKELEKSLTKESIYCGHYQDQSNVLIEISKA